MCGCSLCLWGFMVRIVLFYTQSGGTTGLTPVTISGSSFDTSGSVTIGGLPCVVQSWSAQSIVCLSPAGQGLSRVIQVTTVRTSSGTGDLVTFGYTAPAITGIVFIFVQCLRLESLFSHCF